MGSESSILPAMSSTGHAGRWPSPSATGFVPPWKYMKMEVVYKTGSSDLATVYVARSESGHLLEFVESRQPPLTRDQKWVLIISTLYGCPVNCIICDAGGNYKGR